LRSGEIADGPELILEDDIDVEKELNTVFGRLLKDLPDDWEFFALGHCCVRHNERVTDLISKPHWLYCAHGYILRDVSVVDKLIAASNKPHAQIADVLWRPLMNDRSLRTYYTSKEYIRQDQRTFGSTIDSHCNVGHPFPNV
jgi:hypothetical protein